MLNRLLGRVYALLQTGGATLGFLLGGVFAQALGRIAFATMVLIIAAAWRGK